MADTIALLDNPQAPELFASAATGFFVANGNIAITFESVRADHSTSPGPLNRVVVGRVVMPVQGAQALVVGLFDFLEKQGLVMEKRPGQ
jgi:hypothetical protein